MELSRDSSWTDATGEDGGGLRRQDRQAVVDGSGEGTVSGDGEEGHFAEREMRFYLMDWHQTLLSFFIGVVGGGLLPICLMFVFIAI